MTHSTAKPLIALSPLRFNAEWINSVFTRANRVWIGFSGGVDSHVLLHALVNQISTAQKQKLTVLHVHHGLSANADDWLRHCESIAENLAVSFVAERVQLDAQASLENAARNARYQAFQTVMADQDVILLAHHAGDQVETVLFRLLRGTGGKGLIGIPQERQLGDGHARLIRPLLMASKADIEVYAKQHQLVWIEDESNHDERFSRNFLRHRVVPVLTARFPAMERNIVSSSQRMATDYAMLSQFAQQQLAVWCNAFGGLDLSYIANKPVDERLFWWRHFLQANGVSLTQAQLESVEAMFSAAQDKQPEFVFSHGRIMRHQNAIYLLPPDEGVILATLMSGVRVTRSFDCISVSGNGCALKARPQSESLLMTNGKTRKLKKWLNDEVIPSWWRDHLPYVYQGDTLVAIGDLWCHPHYSHLNIQWQVSAILPFPR
ncbi:tRNA lysidine(34) synthetase TilS [Marinomonas sp. M1K-6]|uniref:tRNA(Ile)-lysidine synthase n=2 Tax=Marinomonas profundi TaxID=2726122 RepID=A0A847R7Z6_9GAMM|nr:tRNA lysidine(34) synthetase TilS [Marinomonas profundi]NLQ18196.1 tRNA lysidine(34) synthetase TilS [Marinomonas profundi]UDV04794.1 tRNA lysidine(34) synthetase TilS [Marinomonas profundi]